MINYAGEFTPKPDRRKCYEVYAEEIHDYGDGNVQRVRRFVGKTWAVSAELAASFVAHRNERAVHEVVPWWGDGARISDYVAVEV